MRPEQQIQQAPRPTRQADMPRRQPIRLDDAAAQLMAAQRHWNDADRALHLSSAQAERELPLPADVQHDLASLSVDADRRIAACESDPRGEALGGPVTLVRNLAGSLREWREAA